MIKKLFGMSQYKDDCLISKKKFHYLYKTVLNNEHPRTLKDGFYIQAGSRYCIPSITLSDGCNPTVVPIQFDGLFEYKRTIESNWD